MTAGLDPAATEPGPVTGEPGPVNDARSAPYYRADLALVHDLGFGDHADGCAPGVLALLEPVRRRGGLELGCGSGRLTRHLVAAGHRVLATDASPAMLELARRVVAWKGRRGAWVRWSVPFLAGMCWPWPGGGRAVPGCRGRGVRGACRQSSWTCT